MIQYLFVDGNCLRMHVQNFSKRYADGKELGVNWKQLKGNYEKVFYYDAIPVQNLRETAEQHSARISSIADLHKAISEVDGYRVYEGDARQRSGNKKALEQKKVDVMIAVDMLTHTIRRNMSRVGLLAGDLDFKPLLDALVSEGMFTTLIFPPRFTTKELQWAADARQPMSARVTYGWLDRESQGLIGRIPHPSVAQTPQVQNCQKILDIAGGPPNLSIWHERPDGTVVLLWQLKTEAFIHLRSANWANTRKIAEDDYGLDLPLELPTEFSAL